MKKQIKVIQVDSSEAIVDSMKLCVAMAMSEWEQDLLTAELPKREDYQTETEYQEEIKAYMTDAVDQIKDLKRQVFCSVLESYNEFLTAKYDQDTNIKNENSKCIEYIGDSLSDMKRAGIITLVLTLILPSALPIIIVLNGTRIGLDALTSKIMGRKIESNNQIQEEIKKIQIPFYEFTDTLRTDYHQSNHELDELREKALKGENVLGKLMEIVNPERVQLPHVEQRVIELEDAPKEYIKKDNQ